MSDDPRLDALTRCVTCEGSGAVPEPRLGFVTETLGCPDCRGTGQGLPLDTAQELLAAADAADPLRSNEAVTDMEILMGMSDRWRDLACGECGGSAEIEVDFGSHRQLQDCPRCKGRVRLGGVSIDPDHLWWVDEVSHSASQTLTKCVVGFEGEDAHDGCGWRALVNPDE